MDFDQAVTRHDSRLCLNLSLKLLCEGGKGWGIWTLDPKCMHGWNLKGE